MTWVSEAPISATQWGSLRGEATVAASDYTVLDAGSTLSILDINWDFGDQLRAEATLTEGLLPAVQPVGDERKQLVGGFRVSIDGVQVNKRRIGPNITLTERDNGTTVLTFSMPMKADFPASFENVQGTFEDSLGPPGGKKSIDVDAIVVTADGPETIVMMRDGIIENTEEITSPEGDFRQYNVIGKHGRYDRKKVEIAIPPGHGLSMEEVVERILTEMGLPTDIQGLGQMPRYKEIVAVDAPGWQLIQDLLKVEDKTAVWDRDGSVAIKKLGYRPDEESTPLWTFELGDILSETGLNVSPAIDGPTRVTVLGQQQLTQDDDGGASTQIEQVEIWQDYGVQVVDGWQNGSGNFVAGGWSDQDSEFQVVQRSTRSTVRQFDTIIGETLDIYAWFNPPRARARISVSTTVAYYTPVWFETSAGPCVRYGSEEFVHVRRERTERQFDSAGYLYRVDKSIFAWYMPRQAVFAKQTWTSAGQIHYVLTSSVSGAPDFTYLNIAFDGCTTEHSHFIEVERDIIIYNVNDDGYIDSETIYHLEMYSRPGAFEVGEPTKQWYYQDGRLSMDVSEELRLSKKTIKTYSVTADGEVEVTTSEEDHDGKVQQTIIENLSGYLPAAELKEDILPDPDEYPNGMSASRYETQTIEAEYISGDLELHREIWDEKLSSTYVENIEEAMFIAETTVREGSAIPVGWTLPFNPIIRPGHICLLKSGNRSQPDMIAYVTEIGYIQAKEVNGETKLLTTVLAKVYVI